MSGHVIDASVVLAFLFKEDGSEAARPLLANATVFALNYSEVVEKLLAKDIGRQQVLSNLNLLRLQIVGFDESDALETAALRNATKSFGLSLADRACLSLARKLDTPVYTADRVWAELDIGIDVRLIR